MPNIVISGVVAVRNMQPYVQIFVDGNVIGQLSMSEARNVANDIVQMCARTEADAMIIKFFGEMDFPQGATAALLDQFRDFRSKLDHEPVTRTEERPMTDA